MANETILSGDINQSGNTTGNTRHIVSSFNVDATAVLDGFTITGGYSIGGTNPNGAGIYNENSSLSSKIVLYIEIKQYQEELSLMIIRVRRL